MSLSHRNQSMDLQGKSIDWFLCERDIDRYRVKTQLSRFSVQISYSVSWSLTNCDLSLA